jgi:hypothetical protein
MHLTQPAVEPDALQLADGAAEAVRGLIHLTRFPDAIADPAELSRLLAELTTLTSRLPQLLDQLHRWLRREHDAARVQADTGTDPDELVRLAAAELTRANLSAHHLAATLDTAHQHVAHLTTAQQGEPNTEARPNNRTQGVSFRP